MSENNGHGEMELAPQGAESANAGVTPPPDPADLLRMGFLAKYDTEYKKRLGISDQPPKEGP